MLVYEVFGTKSDRRSRSAAQLDGGVFEIDPADGRVMGSLVPGAHFSQVVIAPGGDKFFGGDVDSEHWDTVRSVKVDRKSESIDAARELSPGVGSISLADIPSSLIPRQ